MTSITIRFIRYVCKLSAHFNLSAFNLLLYYLVCYILFLFLLEISCIVSSVLLQFAPTYHDYVLYNHSESEGESRKYRARTFVPTGPEMDTVRKNKHVIGNKLEDIQLSSISPSATSTPQNQSTVQVLQDTSKSEAMNSSLLTDASLAVPYDMTLVDIDMSSYPGEVPAANNESGTR